MAWLGGKAGLAGETQHVGHEGRVLLPVARGLAQTLVERRKHGTAGKGRSGCSSTESQKACTNGTKAATSATKASRRSRSSRKHDARGREADWTQALDAGTMHHYLLHRIVEVSDHLQLAIKGTQPLVALRGDQRCINIATNKFSPALVTAAVLENYTSGDLVVNAWGGLTSNYLVINDGAKYVAETPDRFDVIIVDSTDPMGPGEVLFTETFYKNCRRCLNEGGVLVNQNGVPFKIGRAHV